MRKFICAALAASAIAGIGSAANAASVFVANANFEDGNAVAEGQFSSGFNVKPLGWGRVASTAIGRWNPTAANFANHAGVGVVGRSDGSGNGALGGGSLGQDIEGIFLKANTRYTLLVDVGNPTDGKSPPYILGFIAGGVDPAAQGTILAELIGSTDMFGQAIGEGQFGTVQFTFETGASSPYFGKQFGLTLGAHGTYISTLAFDNVRLDVTPLTAGVPEPATWAMMIGGFGLVGGAMRRRSTIARALA